MRILNFSDLHAHAFKPYSDLLPDGMNSRLKDTVRILGEIEELCKQYAVDGVLCAGDLFHARATISVRTFNAVCEAVAKIKMHVDFFGLLVGNHDQTDKKGEIYSTHTLGSVVQVMGNIGWRTMQSESGERLNVLAVPYDPEKEYTLNQIKEFAQAPPTRDPRALLGHFGISGGKVGANFVLIDDDEINLGELPYAQFDQVFLGHYHVPQTLLSNVRFLGATHQHNWGDVGQDRGCWLWDTVEDQEFSEPTFVPLHSAPKFVLLPYDAIINAKTPVTVENDFVRVVCPNWLSAEQWSEAAALVKDAGARRVEPWVEPTALNGPGPVTGDFHPGMDFEEMLDKYVEALDSPLNAERLTDLGQSILKEVS